MAEKKDSGAAIIARVAEVPGVQKALEALALPAIYLEDWMRERVGTELIVSTNEHGDQNS